MSAFETPEAAIAAAGGTTERYSRYAPAESRIMDGFPNPDVAKAPAAATIQVKAGELHLAADAAETAIQAAGLTVYQRGRRLVKPAMQEVPAAKGRTAIAAGFAEISQPGMVDCLSRSAAWRRWDGRTKGLVTIDPPRQIADIVLSRFGDWRFPTVAGVITTPTLRPDNSILAEPGYDRATRLYLMPDQTLVLPTISPYPTRREADAALQLIDALLDGFAFVSPVDRSVALSGLLTTVSRGAMAVAPMHAIRANTAGTGKTHLIDTVSTIATGRPCPVAAAGRDADETDKRLVGLLLSGYPILSLDNVNGELGSDLLCQAVERPTIRLRRLGSSDISEIESRATIFATGNALRVRGDMTRRTLVCDLDAEMERPELRRFPFDPVERVLADRGRYVAAALTIVRAFVTSGAKPEMTPLGSYADYSRTVRGALVWLGRPDPALSMEQARNDDPELTELRDLMAEWAARIGVGVETSAKAVIQAAELRQTDDEAGYPLHGYANAGLRDAILAVAGTRGGTIDGGKFGIWLRSKKGRIVSISRDCGPQRVRLETKGLTSGAARWRLVEVKAEGG